MHCLVKIFFAFSVIVSLTDGGTAQRRTFNWNNYGMKELSADLTATLNRSVDDMLWQVSIRYPQILDVVRDVLNATSKDGINHRYLCDKIKFAFLTKTDACNYPEEEIMQNETLVDVCNETKYNYSIISDQMQDICGTMELPQGYRNFTGNLTGTVKPSSSLFLALKVLAGTAITANKRECQRLGGTFNDLTIACFKNGTRIDTNEGKDNTLMVLDLVLKIISLCSLLVLFVTYFKFRKYESLAGKCIICLSLALLFAQIIEVILSYAGKAAWFCRLGATFLHYFLLLEFSWMATIAFDFFYTFSKVRPVDQRARQRRFKIYCAITFSFATCVIFVCTMIDIPSARHSGYGLNGHCFISRFWANLFAFIVPVAAVLIFNTILLTLTILKLRSSRKSTAKSLGSSGSSSSKKKQMLLSVMALKLSILLGLGWIFGFIDSSIDSKAVTYIYTIVVALQGFLVFIAFGCHGECWKFLRGKYVEATSKSQLTTNNRSIQMNTL